MARPSRNIDRALLAAGRDLLPLTGCRNLSVRQVTERAGVNLGMFHYHFRTRENFVRAVLQEMYEEMFASLQLERARHAEPLPGLRAVLRVLGRLQQDSQSTNAGTKRVADHALKLLYRIAWEEQCK